jgi:hypothetical protein
VTWQPSSVSFNVFNKKVRHLYVAHVIFFVDITDLDDGKGVESQLPFERSISNASMNIFVVHISRGSPTRRTN